MPRDGLNSREQQEACLHLHRPTEKSILASGSFLQSSLSLGQLCTGWGRVG